MSKARQLKFESMDGVGTMVEFPHEGVTADLVLAPEGPRLFRIASVPSFMTESVGFGDVIEAEAQADGSLRFVAVTEKGGWRVFDFLIPEILAESQHLRLIQQRVIALGGHWERVFGGILFLCLPPNSDYDPTEEMNQVPVGEGASLE